MEQILLHWLAQYGDAAIFGLLVFGIVGLPVPDETLLTLAGVLVRNGDLRLVPTYVAAAAGAMTGITVSFAIGRFVGLPLLHRYGRAVHVSEARVRQAHDWFDRGGGWALFAAYWIPGVRHLIALVAGSSELEPRRFALFAYTGALLWSAAFLALGYFLGDRWRPVLDALRRPRLVAAVAAVALGLAWALLRRRRR
jgi:membrane protein DedA with SNARE-associated domain